MSTSAARAPGPRGRIPGSQFFLFRRFRRDPLGFLLEMAREYGDVAEFRLGPQRAFFLNHPDHIRDVFVTHNDHFIKGRALQRSKRLLGEGLLTSEGEFHRRQRRLAQPAFHRQRINGYGALMVDYAARMSARWHEGETIDVAQEMMRLTLAIVGKTLFAADVEGDANDVGAALSEVMELFDMLMMPYSELLEHLPVALPPERRFRRARAQLDAVIYRIVEERRRSREDRGDLLSMLLLAQDEEGDGGTMSDEQVRDEVMTLFLAGHETTANALSWTWYLLSHHADVEAKLHAELDAVLEGDCLPQTEDLARLPYTEMVVAEAMRLYPPAWAVGRLAVKETEIGGYRIPKGALVLVSQYVMHHDARYFPEPGRFDPERWTPEAKSVRPQFSYFPFGGGPRRCIGEAFAGMEGVLLVATIARRWRLRPVASHQVEMSTRLTLRPGKSGLPMTLEKRVQSESRV